MGWMAKRRLRTGPTAALPAKPDQSKLLEILKLADPDAKLDGADVVAADARIHAAVEAEPDLVGGELEHVWACRVQAEGPLPLDYFDRFLAEGVAYRLGGLSVCRGEVTDPAEVARGPIVILPVRPAADELKPLLGEVAHEEGEYGVETFTGETLKVVLVPRKDTSPMALTLMPYAAELTCVDILSLDGEDDLLLERGALALAIADAFQGVAVDQWRFRIDAPEDLLPPA
ncbi:hypothetical protein ACIBG8_25275 [Nonomuraea sp. NPDC050556]|uniref:hypothetical protein n=1 Tax=Nonomuraea sp. NPDC050556 TaxID=3364369 RepID=UPI0037987EF6